MCHHVLHMLHMRTSRRRNVNICLTRDAFAIHDRCLTTKLSDKDQVRSFGDHLDTSEIQKRLETARVACPIVWCITKG